ncbi:TAXI family TRAP transporter solute-binding subunit [Ekhidna sp. MALMAid0563]|uniref:TAXI family TRAP transporter solute-binding subunit n=1 Tax=Ekhidna sp. MALMAid0563 TaxID=3143937 RepID=UPI0032DF910D
MKKITATLIAAFLIVSCNPTLTTFTFIYNDEGPNGEIAKRMEELLEGSFYNVDIQLIKGKSTNANLDSLSLGSVDIALVENYVNYQPGLNSAFSVYSEVLHIFFQDEIDGSSFESLMYSGPVYIGREESPTYNMMMDLIDFYGLDTSRINVTFAMNQAGVVVELTNLFTSEKLKTYEGYNLFSFDKVENLGNASTVEGIALKYPRMSPFVIPQKSYWGYTEDPIVTLAVDLIMMVRSGLLEVTVNDFTKTMLRNRQVFTSIDPLLFDGLREDFNQGILNIPLHEGARTFLDRDEPSFLERYAELGGVILSIVIALFSGIVSLTKWQAQKKKDKIDEFYEDLMNIKNAIPKINQISSAIEKVKRVQASQNKAFEMLIAEKLVANDSFRIYMELSKETINELRGKMRVLKAKKERTTS